MICIFLSVTGEQTGVLWVFERDVTAAGGWRQLARPFMNISVHIDFEDYDEQGFLAVRFHPQFSSNGLLYSWYSIFEAGFGRSTRLSEFRVCGLHLKW